MFYIKSVEKVELRRHALIIFTRNLEQVAPPVYQVANEGITYCSAIGPLETAPSTILPTRWKNRTNCSQRLITVPIWWRVTKENHCLGSYRRCKNEHTCVRWHPTSWLSLANCWSCWENKWSFMGWGYASTRLQCVSKRAINEGSYRERAIIMSR